jgi:hypothetical protein
MYIHAKNAKTMPHNVFLIILASHVIPYAFRLGPEDIFVVDVPDNPDQYRDNHKGKRNSHVNALIRQPALQGDRRDDGQHQAVDPARTPEHDQLLNG